MLWSLTITSKKEVTFQSPMDIRVTKAILEPNVSGDAVFLLNAKYNDPVSEKNVVVPVAVLRAPVDSTPLDLLFDEDEEIVFSVSGGDATIHLTGYFVLDNNEPFDELDEIDMEDLEDDVEDVPEDQPKRKIPLSVPVGKKQKVETSPPNKQPQPQKQKGQPPKQNAPQKKGNKK